MARAHGGRLSAARAPSIAHRRSAGRMVLASNAQPAHRVRNFRIGNLTHQDVPPQSERTKGKQPGGTDSRALQAAFRCPFEAHIARPPGGGVGAARPRACRVTILPAFLQ